MEKSVYVCGPLTDLPPDIDVIVLKEFYEGIADVAKIVTGTRGFVPHEYYDPKIHAKYTSEEVDRAERKQVCENTSCLVVVAAAPSWGGGIEVEMANQSGVPAILLRPEGKTVSRLLRGNPAIRQIIPYSLETKMCIFEVLQKIEIALRERIFRKELV